MNLLVENISNQRLPASVVEDGTNKPWRPIPAGRISAREAQCLLLAAIPTVVGASFLLDAFTPSIVLMALVWMYNDLDGAGINIWVRNLLNGGGLMCFSWGALRVLSGADLKPAACIWILVTGAIITTTVHAQDFPDVEGDREIGRQTVPLLLGEGPARASLRRWRHGMVHRRPALLAGHDRRMDRTSSHRCCHQPQDAPELDPSSRQNCLEALVSVDDDLILDTSVRSALATGCFLLAFLLHNYFRVYH